ncbi:MAG: thiamine pyrophosphate-dependent enzyme [Candidatus Korobacteraceae bacterium]|jgi:pyruvate/2-oxoacid:ferredoxin oxidoreductase beta subunit
MTEQLIYHGLTTCEGCGMEIIARAMVNALGPRTIVLTPPSCSAIITGFGRQTGWRIPAFQSNLENIAAYMSGIREGLEITGQKDICVVGLAGDGGTVDIGLQALSGAIERGHKFIYICYDNEAYMNTGIQRSGATPQGAWTTTTPGGKPEMKKDIVGMLLAQGIAYAATASIGYVDDLAKKIRRAKDVDGPSYIHVHQPCGTGWRFPASQTINVARAAVDSGLWPLFEVVDGQVHVTKKVKQLKPLSEYVKSQGRFANLSAEVIELWQQRVHEKYSALILKEGHSWN